MEGIRYTICPECASKVQTRQPFCQVCGKLCPAVWHHGNMAVELGDAPSERTRTELVRTLTAWFPTIDAGEAAQRLKAGRSILLRGIDDESGERILDALRCFKVPARLVSSLPQASGAMRLFNPGLAAGSLLLLVAAVIDGWTGRVLLAGALGSPVAWLLWRIWRERPLVSAPGMLFDHDKWSRLAVEYGRTMKDLDPADAGVLRSVATEVFDLYGLLGSESLAAAAAGQERGDFHSRLTDALTGAIEIGRSMTEADEENLVQCRQELQSLADLVKSAGEWFRGLETQKAQALPVLSAQLHEITDRIDRTIREVRPADRHIRRPSPKIRA